MTTSSRRPQDEGQAPSAEGARPRLRLDRFLPHQLSVLSNTVSRSIAGKYAERYGLSIPEWRVIAVLQYFPKASSGELTEKTGMDNVAVSRAVNHLVKAGLITRRTRDSDRRRTVLDLSEEGQRVYDEITPLALEYEARLLKGLSENERRLLDRLLTKLQAQAKQL
jgi:DNA-binding MarR family transcriptional regulator